MDRYTSFIEIAKRLNVVTDTIRRSVKKYKDQLNLQPKKMRTADSKGALVDCLSFEDAEILIDFYERRGENSEIFEENSFQRYGVFYMIQLIPEFDSNRIKIGFTENINKRLIELQISSPTAKLIRTWPCKRSWDYAAMDSITRKDCKLVMNEVYEGNVEGFIERGDDFFSMMPNEDNNVELSQHSPIANKQHIT